MSNGLGRLWVAEYSREQDCYHVDQLGRTIRKNMHMVAEKRNNDYLMFGLFQTHDEAHDACTRMRAIHKQRGQGGCANRQIAPEMVTMEGGPGNG